MSIFTTFPAPLIVSDLPVDTPVVLDEVGSTTADGWDTLTQSYAMLSSVEIKPETLDAPGSFEIGRRLDFRFLYCQGISNFRCKGSNLYTWTASFLGFMATKPVVVSYDGAADQQTGENITSPDGFHESLMTHENSPSATVKYVTTNIATVATNQVGRAKTPPSAPAVSASVWTLLTKYTYHWPNGWVLMASKTTPLPGTIFALVDDRYQYIRAYSPRS